MRICSYKGLVMVVMLRDEHCPPHAHVDGGRWSARFKFSFWHNGVELWDVIPYARRPPLAVLEGLRQELKQPAHLQRARTIWWAKIQTACLDNQLWDWQADEVVATKRPGSTAYLIESARYELEGNRTLLELVGAPDRVEIEL
jgi:hypothetical protein